MTYKSVLEEIRASAEAAGRNLADLRLVAVSKTQSAEAIETLYDAGQRDFGENRVQEALEKQLVCPKDVRWHLIGSLQRKKVPKVIGRFALIHSVDSAELAEKIASCSAQQGLQTSVLLQVNCSGEESKHGLAPGDWERVLPEITQLAGLSVQGLMTMAPLTDDEALIRACFRQLRELRDAWGLSELSMGMSNDFRIAIEEGATLLRIGRALFN